MAIEKEKIGLKERIFGYSISLLVFVSGVGFVGNAIWKAFHPEEPKNLSTLAADYGLSKEAAAIMDAVQIGCPVTAGKTITEGRKKLCQIIVTQANREQMTILAVNKQESKPAATGNPNQNDPMSANGQDTEQGQEFVNSTPAQAEKTSADNVVDQGLDLIKNGIKATNTLLQQDQKG